MAPERIRRCEKCERRMLCSPYQVGTKRRWLCAVCGKGHAERGDE